MTERVMVYIDGFNLYHGIKHQKWAKYLWLDIQLLSSNLLSPGSQRLEGVHYFTSVIFHESQDPHKKGRQSTYLKAINTKQNVNILYGAHRKRRIRCKKCNSSFRKFEEKMTDVNIAVKLIDDAYDNLYDTAFLISGDEDLSSAVESVIKRHANKQVVIYFPPGRTSQHSKLIRVASHVRTINQTVLAKSQFPNPVITQNNRKLYRPPSWA